MGAKLVSDIKGGMYTDDVCEEGLLNTWTDEE
jgi:hypothetical protein